MNNKKNTFKSIYLSLFSLLLASCSDSSYSRKSSTITNNDVSSTDSVIDFSSSNDEKYEVELTNWVDGFCKVSDFNNDENNPNVTSIKTDFIAGTDYYWIISFCFKSHPNDGTGYLNIQVEIDGIDKEKDQISFSIVKSNGRPEAISPDTQSGEKRVGAKIPVIIPSKISEEERYSVIVGFKCAELENVSFCSTLETSNENYELINHKDPLYRGGCSFTKLKDPLASPVITRLMTFVSFAHIDGAEKYTIYSCDETGENKTKAFEITPDDSLKAGDNFSIDLSTIDKIESLFTDGSYLTIVAEGSNNEPSSHSNVITVEYNALSIPDGRYSAFTKTVKFKQVAYAEEYEIYIDGSLVKTVKRDDSIANDSEMSVDGLVNGFSVGTYSCQIKATSSKALYKDSISDPFVIEIEEE